MLKRCLSGFGSLALLMLMGSGCSSVSDIYTQKNPQWSGKPVERVMVVGDFPNLADRRNAESEMCEAISDASSSECFQSLDYVFASGHEDKEITAAMNKHQIGALIYVSNQGSGSDVVSTPTIVTTTAWSTGLLTSIGSGGSKSVSWANYSIKVYLPNGLMIWNGGVKAGGDDKDELIEDSSEAAASEMADSGIILPPKPD